MSKNQQVIDQFDEFVEVLRQGKYPDYAKVVWTGETSYIEFSLKLDWDNQAGVEDVRERVAGYLRKLNLMEKNILHITVHIKAGKPVQAVVAMTPEVARAGVLKIGTARLKELQEIR